MSGDNGGIGVEDVRGLWGSGSDWVLDAVPIEKEIAEENPDTGVVTYKTLKPLNLREEVFVQEFIKNKCDKKATAKVLSITTQTATGFLQRKHVKSAIQDKIRSMVKAAEMSETWVMQNLREVIERCMDSDHFDASCALRGLELVGKKFAMWTDKTEVQQSTVIRIESNVPFDPLLVGSGKGKPLEISNAEYEEVT